MFLIPVKIETLFRHYPITNWIIMLLTIAVTLAIGNLIPEPTVLSMVLIDWEPSGLFGHVLLHGDLIHLAGNMIFLWVFGNVICGNTSNLIYPLLYVGFGLAAAAAHLTLDGDPAVGASGAINGVVGMALAMYPRNHVVVWWFAFFRTGTFRIPLWQLALFWLAFDIWGAATHGAGVAYWAHLGGFFAGLATGCAALRTGWLSLTEIDNESLVEIFQGKTAEERRERFKEAEREERRRARQSEAASASPSDAPTAAAETEGQDDPFVMPGAMEVVQAWLQKAQSVLPSAEDQTILDAGGSDGDRRRFELLYGRPFVAMGYSFHRTLADYYGWVAGTWPRAHESEAVSYFLHIVETDFAAMCACGFIDAPLATLRQTPAIGNFLAGTQT